MKKAISYAKQNHDRFINDLFALMRIPSISALPSHAADMMRCAEAIRERLTKAGADHAEVMPTTGAPVVYASKTIDTKAKTVLIYGHYDVMPVEPLELWTTPPFEPEIREGKIWGRGADDDKGQGFMHIAAFEALVAGGELPCNVKFLFEGEEEIGSPALNVWCEEHKELLAADLILVSDTSMASLDCPTVTCGLRGLAYLDMTVTGPDRDLHSGLFGGAVANPIDVLAGLIAGLHDDNGRVTIEGFYDDVVELTAEERAEIAKRPFDEEAYRSSLKVGALQGETGYTTPERTGVRPALDVNGIWGGHIGEGSKTVIPSQAHAKVSMRLVANQDHNKIAELFIKHIEREVPASVKVEVTPSHGGAPYMMSPSHPAYKAASKAIEDVLGKPALPFFSGGSIPVISKMSALLGAKALLLGFGLGSDNTHSPDENYPVENFEKGIETIIRFYGYYFGQ